MLTSRLKSPPQQREEISSLHDALIKDLSEVLSPQHYSWHRLLELFGHLLDPDQLSSGKITNFTEICKSLVVNGEISDGSYKPLLEIVRKIDVTAAELITKAADEIYSIKVGGPTPVKRQRQDEEESSDSESMMQSLTLKQEQGYSSRTEEAIEATKLTVEAQTKQPEIIPTQALKDAKEKLMENSIVIIRGGSGDGKTLLSYQLLRWLMDDKSVDTKLVKQPLQLHHSIEDVGDKMKRGSRLAIFVDDVSENVLEELKVRDDFLQSTFDGKLNSKSNCLILNIHDEVFNSMDLSSCKLFSAKNIINLRGQNCMTREEKLLVLDAYTPKSHIWSDDEKFEIINSAKELGFPQSCRLYGDIPYLQKMGVKFFKTPFECMQEALGKLSNEHNSALLFLFLNGGGVKMDHLEPNRGIIDKKKLDIAFSGSEVSYGDKMRCLRKSLDEMTGSFVSKLGFWFYDDDVDDNDETEYYQFCQIPTKPVNIFGFSCYYNDFDDGGDDDDDEFESDELYKHDDPHLANPDSEDFDGSVSDHSDGSGSDDSDNSNHSDDSDSDDSCSDEEEFFTFSHDSIQNAFAIVYGQNTKTGFIENCHGKSLRYVSTLTCVTTSSRSLNKVVVSPDEYIHVFPRLLRELECKKSCHIDSLDVWADRQFLERFVGWANDQNVDKLALLKKACSSRASKLALHLLATGVHPDADMPVWTMIRGNVDVLRKCFRYFNDKIKVSLLNEACSSCAEECVLFLLSMGVKPNRDTPLWSMIKGDVDMLKKIIKDQHDEVKVVLLNEAAYHGADECCLHLLSAGVKPDKETPSCVVYGGSMNIFLNVLQYDVTSTARSEITKCCYPAFNVNVLHEACLREREEMVSILCDTYPHLVFEQDAYGQTALHFAAMAGNCSIFHKIEQAVLKSLHNKEEGPPKCETVDGRVVHKNCVCARYMGQLVAVIDWTVLHYSCMSGRSKDLCLYLCQTYPALTAQVDKRNFHCLHHLVRCTTDVDWFTRCDTYVKQYIESIGRKHEITTILTAEGESIADMAGAWGIFFQKRNNSWETKIQEHLAGVWHLAAASANGNT